jgi:hypothetical protein
MGVRRFDQPEDVADFVANVFLEVLRSAGGFDPGRGHAVAWLYGLGSNVAAAMHRQQARVLRAEQQLQGRALLDAAAMRTMMIEIQPGPKDPPTKDGGPIMSFVPERVAAISVAAFDAKATRIASGIPVTVPEAEAGTGPGIDPTAAAPSRR